MDISGVSGPIAMRSTASCAGINWLHLLLSCSFATALWFSSTFCLLEKRISPDNYTKHRCHILDGFWVMGDGSFSRQYYLYFNTAHGSPKEGLYADKRTLTWVKSDKNWPFYSRFKFACLPEKGPQTRCLSRFSLLSL